MQNTSARRILACCALLGGAVAATSAQAEPKAGQSFAVRAYVAESCEISASDIFVGAGEGTSSGTVFESCNTQEGFQVVAQHRWLDRGERVQVSYAGQTSYLQPDGWSHVATRMGAKHGLRRISVRHDGLAQPLSIGLTITTL